MRSEPFALHLYRRFLDGESVQQLASGLSIPEDRVGQRIRAAALFHERQKAHENLIALCEPPGAGPTPGRMEGAGPDCCHWELPETGISIRLSLEVVDRLEREALESFRAIAKRGSEIGGLLLGQVSRDRRAIAITDFELVACDYSRSPLYQLSEEDQRRLEAAIARPRESLSVVGFFRSNTRKELALDANDAALTERYFPSRDSLVLLVKPFSMKPSLGGFFLREQGQSSPSIEFPFRRSELRKLRPVAVAEDRVAVNLCALDEAVAAPEPASPVAAPAPAPPRQAVLAPPRQAPHRAAHQAPWSRRWLWLPMLAAALSGGVYSGYHPSGPLLPAPQPSGGTLSLSVERHAGQLLLGWNRSALVIAQAQRATLSILDGTQEQNLDLDLGQLRTGSLAYTPSTGDVTFRLEVTDLKNGKSVTESIQPRAGRPSPLGPPLLSRPDPRNGETGLSIQRADPPSSPRRLAPIALSRPLRHRATSDR